MGNQNNSVARKRLSTLAITTTLAAVGVGVVGTGAANAATGSPLAQTQTGTTASKTTVALAVTTDAKALKATANLTNFVLDPSVTDFSKVTITADWGDKTGPDTTTFSVDSTGKLVSATGSHTYATAKDYTVTITVDDGIAKTAQSAAANFVADPVLKAALTPSTTKKNTAVTLSLAGSTVDPAAAMSAQTTVDWGDKTTPATFTGDPALIKTTDSKLSHPYAADGSYTLTVKLDDGLGDPNSVQTQTIAVTVADGVVVARAAGNDRYGTGLTISQHQWASTGVTTDTREKAKSVVLATGNDYADALVAVPLAKKAQGPLLLTDGLQKTVNADVLNEIKRVLPTAGTTIYIAGGEKAVSADIESQLKGLGYTVTRLAGTDRFGTALDIAKKGMDDPSHIIVARGDEGTNGDGFADALSAGPYAADVWGGGNSAVVLSNFKTFDANTAAYVTSKLHAGQQDVAAIGGQAAAAMGTIKGSTGLYVSAVGLTRYETAEKVAQAFEPAPPSPKNLPVGIATGMKFPDALTGGAEMATIGGPLLLTDPSTLSDATKAELTDVAATVPSVTIFGGEKAISPAVANAIATLLKATTISKF